MLNYCSYCGTLVPSFRTICDVCGPSYPPEPSTQNVNYSVNGKQTKDMPNQNYSYPSPEDEMLKLFNELFNPKQPKLKPKAEKVVIRLPEISKPETQSLNDVADEVLGNKIDGGKALKHPGDIYDDIYNEMLDRQDNADLQEIIDELVKEERRKDELAAIEMNTIRQKKCCPCCGGRMVTIRGKHPGDDSRIVCPTCMADRLDMIREMTDPNYGQNSCS